MAKATNLDKLLKNSAKKWASKYTALAKAKAPKHIAPHISTKSSVDGSGNVTLTSTVKVVNKPNYGTMDAVAQEYGYPGAVIEGKPYLVFPWDMVTVGVPRTKDGKAVLHKVVRKPMPAFNEDRGYMRPAADEWTQEMLASSDQFAQAIKLDILESFTKITKASLSK